MTFLTRDPICRKPIGHDTEQPEGTHTRKPNNNVLCNTVQATAVSQQVREDISFIDDWKSLEQHMDDNGSIRNELCCFSFICPKLFLTWFIKCELRNLDIVYMAHVFNR